MVDPGTAYAIVTAVGYPIVQLGGIGAAYVGPLIGFGATGIVRGSLAAAAQSSIPNVVAGSVFATAAVGSVVGLPTVMVGAATYGAYRVYRWFR